MSQQLSPISANGGGKSSRPSTANAKEDRSRGEIKKDRKEGRIKKRANAEDVGEKLELITKRAGDAAHYPREGDTVRIHYVGSVKGGAQFDSSHARNLPLEFTVGRGAVIKGLDEGIQQMSKNQMAELRIHFEWGYGYVGYPPIIPPKADLVYEVELLGVSPDPKRAAVKPIQLEPVKVS